jgi:hypothetical protein
MERPKIRARLPEHPENPLGEREIEVLLDGDAPHPQPIVDFEGDLHELKLVSYADGEDMPQYAYERAAHGEGAPQGYGCP